MNKFLLSLVLAQARKAEKILDIGAGIGTFASALMRNGYRVHCIEPDKQHASRIANAGLLVATTLEEIEDCSCDYIYSMNVLEHIEDDVTALRQWYQKLKPGGTILLYVPAFQLLYSSMDRKVGHFRRYTRRELSEKVQTVGFEVVGARYVDCIGFLASLLYKLFGNNAGDLNRWALMAYDRFVLPMSLFGDIFLGKLFGKNVLLTATRKVT
jgi:SAM-dependent methyltransferase